MNRISMKLSPDDIAKYAWIALSAVLILVLVVVIVIPNTETRSTCRGFQYFVFLSQKMTPDQYSIELLNGVRDIHVKGMQINGVDMASNLIDVKSGDSFIMSTSKDPTTSKPEEVFGSKISILYDMEGIKDNLDTATCTGKVQ